MFLNQNLAQTQTDIKMETQNFITECGYCGARNSDIKFNRDGSPRILCRVCGYEAPDLSYSSLSNNDSNVSYSGNKIQKF